MEKISSTDRVKMKYEYYIESWKEGIFYIE